MPFHHLHSNESAHEDQDKQTIAEVESVLAAIRALGPDADPAAVRALLARLAPSNPSELEYVPLEEAA